MKMKHEKGCMKCGSTDAGTKEIATTGTGLSKMLDVQKIGLQSFIARNVDIVNYIKNKPLQHQISLIYF
jgi:uncharacterized protein